MNRIEDVAPDLAEHPGHFTENGKQRIISNFESNDMFFIWGTNFTLYKISLILKEEQAKPK